MDRNIENLEIKVKEIIERRKKVHPQDDIAPYYFWLELTEALVLNQDITISFLKTCSEEEVYWISEVFDDISERMQSFDFIVCLEELNEKYPKLNLRDDIEYAKEYIYSWWVKDRENWKVRLLSDRINRFLYGKGDFYFAETEEYKQNRIKTLIKEDKFITEEFLSSASEETKKKIDEILNKK